MAFKQTGRIGNDLCDLSQRNLQNNASMSYMVVPVQPTGSGLDFGLDHQMQVKTAYSTAGLTSGLVTKPKSRITLQSRQFLTVPYLGKGKHDVDLESQLRTHRWEPNKKTSNPASEANYIEYHQTPMIDGLKNTISNPQYLVEEAANEGWRRGGQSSRDLARE